MLICRSGCDRWFKSIESMDQHCQASHGTFICTKGCRRQFNTMLGRMNHEKVTHLSNALISTPAPQPPASLPSGYLRCRHGCLKSFSTSDGRDHHEKIVHGVSRTLAKPVTKLACCSDCGKDFASWEALRQHQSSFVDHTQLATAPHSLECSQCGRMLGSQEALEQHFTADHPLVLICKEHGEGAQLKRNFRQKWLKQRSIPDVLFVYKIYNLGWRICKFKDYKASISNQGNVVRRYHGTTVQCELGAGVSTKLCQNTACGLCGIIRSGFKTAKARSGWQRFGPGIYTTETSSKSNDYVRTISRRRAVLVCDVAAGNAFRTKVNMPELKGPPEGYDSVCGDVGMDLNYDETVIYKSKAILPRFLLIYQI